MKKTNLPSAKNSSTTPQTIYIQGTDFKARAWMSHSSSSVVHFTTALDMLHMLGAAIKSDIIIYRYQNNPSRLVATLLVCTLLIAQLVRARLSKIRIVWVCHNVDQDTAPHFKILERFRRRLLMRWAHLVCVLDPLFLPHMPRRDTQVVSFGTKSEGAVTKENLERIAEFSAKYDLVVLIAGQDGGKYLGFSRIPEILSCAAAKDISVGFVTAGIADDRVFDDDIDNRVLRITEKNLDEKMLVPYVDYIFRENDDISMPFTVYAAATAHIPLLTWDPNILTQIVVRERIGIPLSEITHPVDKDNFAFDEFLEKHHWNSLHDVLLNHGIAS